MLNRPTPRHFRDLEDQIIRVKVMASIANHHLAEMEAVGRGDVFEQLCHLVRATAELAEQLHDDFCAVPTARAAA